MKNGDVCKFWEKLPEGRLQRAGLYDRRAVVQAEEVAICDVCKEPEVGHARPNRKHGFVSSQKTYRVMVEFPVSEQRLQAETTAMKFVRVSEKPEANTITIGND